MATDTKHANSITLAGTKLIEEKEYYDKNLQVILEEDKSLSQFFEQDTQPYNTGKTFTFRKTIPITPPTAPLEEGVIPDPNKIGLREYKVSMNPWGDYFTFTDEIKKYAIDDIVGDMSDALGNSAVELMNQRRYLAMTSSGNHWFAGLTNEQVTGALTTIRESVGGITISDLPKIKAFLFRMKVKPLPGGDYVFIVSPEIEADMMSPAKNTSQYTFIELTKNANYKPIYEGEIGRILGFRFVVNNAIVEQDGVHKCIILGMYQGKKALIERAVGSGKPEMIFNDLGSSGANDPLKQKGTVGYKIDAVGFAVRSDVACLVYECKPTLSFDTEYPQQAESLIIKQVNIGGTTGEVTPNKILGQGSEEITKE